MISDRSKMDIFRRRMSLKELPILNKGYASSPTMTRTKSASSSNNRKYLPFRQRSGSINPASFLKGNGFLHKQEKDNKENEM